MVITGKKNYEQGPPEHVNEQCGMSVMRRQKALIESKVNDDVLSFPFQLLQIDGSFNLDTSSITCDSVEIASSDERLKATTLFYHSNEGPDRERWRKD